jgi:stromal membrane-associated protein
LNSALESFIRAKYEQRKWIAKEWIPPEITVSSDVSVVLLLDYKKKEKYSE